MEGSTALGSAVADSPAPEAPKPQAKPTKAFDKGPEKTAEQQRADEIFGEEPSGTDNPENFFGVKTAWRGKPKGRNEHVKQHKPSEKASAPQTDAKPGPSSPAEPSSAASDPGAPDAEAPEQTEQESDQPEELVEIKLGAKRNKDGTETGGTVYKVPKHVAHAWNSLKGQYNSFQSSAYQANHVANQWKAHAESLTAQIGELKKQLSERSAPSGPAGQSHPTQQTGTSGTSAKPDGLFDAMDWGSFKQLLASDPTTAVQWLTDESEKHYDRRLQNAIAELRSEFAASLDPLKGQHQQYQELRETAEFFERMRATRDPIDNSKPYYPGLDEQRVVEGVVAIWHDYPEQFRKTEKAFHAAYVTFMDAARRNGWEWAFGQDTGNRPAADNPAARLLEERAEEARHDSARAQAIVSGGATTPRPTQPPRQLSRSDAVLQGIEKAGDRHPFFGTRPNFRR